SPTAHGLGVNAAGAGGVEPGSLYLSAGYFDNRVLRYGPTGELKEIWGVKTIASGPDLPDQVSTLTVSATAGTYEITAQTASGHGEFTAGSKIVKGVRTEGGAYRAGDTSEGAVPAPTVNRSGDITSGSTTVASLPGASEWLVGMVVLGP